MKKAILSLILGMSIGLGAAQAQLKIAFATTGGKVAPGYEAYYAADKTPDSFTAQSYTAFGAKVTIKATWPEPVQFEALRMIDRGPDVILDPQDLLRFWIGTDTRVAFDPVTLTISGLPAGVYDWLSYHHDPKDQTGTFDMAINDATGSKTITGTDISNGSKFKLEDATKIKTTITSDGKDVKLVFKQTPYSDAISEAIFVMNAFELTQQAAK